MSLNDFTMKKMKEHVKECRQNTPTMCYKKATNKLKIVEVAETENLTKSIKDEVNHFSNNNTYD